MRFIKTTVKAKHNGYMQDFTALTHEGETWIDKAGYLNRYLEPIRLGDVIIEATSFEHAFDIIRHQQETARLRTSLSKTLARIDALENQVLKVLANKLRGVKRQTRLNNFFNKGKIR